MCAAGPDYKPETGSAYGSAYGPIPGLTRLDARDPQSLEQAWLCVQHSGCLLLEGLYPQALVDRLALGFAQGYAELTDSQIQALGMKVGAGRVMLPLPLWPPYAGPELYAQPLLMALLSRLLGEGFVLSSCSVVLALPGAGDQQLHRDNELLFGKCEASVRVPPYALTLALPLLDLSETTGTTELFPGSHLSYERQALGRCHPVRPMCRRGDAFLMDYRLIHRGTANPGNLRRPVLYLSYSRPWYIDTANYLEKNFPALLVHPRLLAEAPPPLRRLLARAGLEHRAQIKK